MLIERSECDDDDVHDRKIRVWWWWCFYDNVSDWKIRMWWWWDPDDDDAVLSKYDDDDVLIERSEYDDELMLEYDDVWLMMVLIKRSEFDDNDESD